MRSKSHAHIAVRSRYFGAFCLDRSERRGRYSGVEVSHHIFPVLQKQSAAGKQTVPPFDVVGSPPGGGVGVPTEPPTVFGLPPVVGGGMG